MKLLFCFLLVSYLILPGLAKAQDVKWLWSSGAANTGYGWGNDVVVDKLGNTYIAGVFSDTLRITAASLYSKGGTDGFFAKYDPAGHLLWAKQIGGPGDDQARNLAVSDAGDIY